MRELSPVEIAIDNAIQELNRMRSDNRIIKTLDLLNEAKSLASDIVEHKESWLDKYSKFLSVDKIVCIKEHNGFVVGGVYNIEIELTKEKNYIRGLFIKIERGDSINAKSINENSSGKALENFVTIAEYRASKIEELL